MSAKPPTETDRYPAAKTLTEFAKQLDEINETFTFPHVRI